MSKTFEAIFDGEVLRPEEPLELEPRTRVRVTVEEVNASPTQHKSFLQTACSLNLRGPSDWSARLDEYLYGAEED